MYRVETIAGIGDLVIPRSPEELLEELGRGLTPNGGGVVPPAPSPPPASSPAGWSAPALFALGGAAGLALGFVLFRK